MFASSNRFFLYALFIFSTFSIAGSEASIMGLYVLAIIRISKKTSFALEETRPLFFAILFFMGVSLLSGILNEYQVNHLMALRSNWRLLLPFALMFALEGVNTKKLLQYFFVFLCIISVYGLIQLFTGADWLRPAGKEMTTPYLLAGENSAFSIFHAKGNFTHHLTFGGLLVLCFPPFAALSLCKETSVRFRVISGAGATLMFLAIIASLGRSVWLGALLALAILFFWFSRKLFFVFFGLGVALFVFLLTQITFKEAVPSSDSQISSHQVLSEQAASTPVVNAIERRFTSAFSLGANRDRLLMWQSALAAIKDHPLLGIGYATDQEVMPPYREAVVQGTPYQFLNASGVGVHNIYLQTWLNYGVFGLLAYLSILALFLRFVAHYIQQTEAFSSSNAWLWGTIAGILGFMVAGTFENNFRDGEVQTALLMLMGIALHLGRTIKLNKKGTL